MIILKVKIKRDQTEKGTHYTYPPEYDPKKIQVLCYESSLPENYQAVITRGNKDEYLLGLVKDEDIAGFMVSKDIIEIDSIEASKLGNQWVKAIKKITDPILVISICEKISKGESLTQDEKDAINPDNTTKGINRTKTFDEILGLSFSMP